jgi:site-specific recombinase XerD
MKRTESKIRDYVTREEMDAILTTFDQDEWLGRRNYALLLTMYNTGARVSEIVTIRRDQVQVRLKGQVQLYGKGRKQRQIPRGQEPRAC